jgi:hypothetical protein
MSLTIYHQSHVLHKCLYLGVSDFRSELWAHPVWGFTDCLVHRVRIFRAGNTKTHRSIKFQETSSGVTLSCELLVGFPEDRFPGVTPPHLCLNWFPYQSLMASQSVADVTMLSVLRDISNSSLFNIRVVIAQSVLLWARGWTIGVVGFDYRRGLGIFLFTTTSRTALGPTQPPTQWLPGAFSLGVKRLGREVDHSPPSSAEVKEWVKLYIHSPNTSSFHGVQLKKSAGTTVV